MSSAGQRITSSTPIYIYQLIIDALADYTKVTGIDLSKFAAELELSNSPQSTLLLLQERIKASKVDQNENQRLMNCLSSTVSVIHAFSGILGEVDSLLPVPLVKTWFVAIDVLLAAASGAPSRCDTLLELFELMGSFLKRLEIYTRITPSPITIDMVVKIILESLTVLSLAMKQLKEDRFKKFAKKLLRESEIESVLQRLDRLTEDEARITVAQTLGVVHGLVGSVKVAMEDEKVPMDGIREDLVSLHQALNEINRTKRERLRRDVQRWLSPPDPSTDQNFVQKARHKGTAAWLFESNAFTEWKSRGPLLWLHGKPGAGKSTLISAIIQDIERMHAAGLATMAYYYFDFRDVGKQDCYGLLSSLILQLAAESDSCHDILSYLYSDTSRGTQKPDIDALKTCMTDMLSLPGQGPIYIIADALDECPNFLGGRSAREEVLELIEGLVDLKLPNLHLCVASQPEIDIRTILEPLTSLEISLHDESGQKEDIIEFISSVVRLDRSMRRWKEEDKQLVVDVLSEKAHGVFLWVVYQVDRLRRTFPTNIRKVMNDLPMTLGETYNLTLKGIDDEKREYAHRLFQCLAVSIRPLRVEELAEVLAIDFESYYATPAFIANWRPERAEEIVMSVCSSLIAIVGEEGHRVVQFSHISAKECLTSGLLAAAESPLSYYHILPEPAHTTLALASLSVLLQLHDRINRDDIAHFPLAPYAARHWVYHAQFGNVSSHTGIREAMERLFDPARRHFAAWVWLYDIDYYWTEGMPTIHPTPPEAAPLYYASLCGFRSLVEHLIVSHSQDVNIIGGFHTTPLLAASTNGHLEVASLLTEHGADIGFPDEQGRTPLHRVSQGEHLVMPQSSLDFARHLVRFGAHVNDTDNQGRTPLHAAVRSGYLDLVRLLLECGASLGPRDSDQSTPLHLACALGKLGIAHFLIDSGSEMESQDENGCIPLHVASRFGHVDVARLLLDGGSDVNVRDKQRWTPLHYASRYGRPDLAQLLIDRGADVNVYDEDRWTALHFVSHWHGGRLDIAKLLIDYGADVNSRKDEQKTSLDLTSRVGDLEIARILLENGAELSARDDDGWTPLHTASYFGHLHVARFLLGCGIDVDIRNGNEETSLYLASSSGKVDVVRFLIEQGTDIHIRTKSGWNPVHIASQYGHLDVVRQLINTGVPIDIRNGDQQTPLALASRDGEVEVGRLLIERGADIKARDKRSRSPLHLATQYGHFDMARLLLDHGVDPNIQKDNLWSPLHLASAHGHLGVVELLVQRGARVDLSNGRKETPLHLAAGNGKVEIACFLIDHGAALQMANNNGWTPLHSGARRGHLGVVKLLLEHGADVHAVNGEGKTPVQISQAFGYVEVADLLEA